MQQPYPTEDFVRSDRSKSKSTLSLLWEELYGPPIDLQQFVDSCWSSHKTVVDIDIDDAKTPPEQQQDQIDASKPLLKDSGTSSLNDEDQCSIPDGPNHNGASRTPVSVKSMVQQFSQCSNGVRNPEWDRGKWHLVVRELIESEKIYLKSLTEVELGYLTTPNTVFINDRDVAIIFSNWKKLRLFHSHFLTKLKSARSYEFNGLLKLSQCFTDEVNQFEELYTEYCTNYLESTKHLHNIENNSSDTWRSLLTCQNELGHQLPLSTFLLKPVQRILKYHLLLKELIQGCKPSQHPNHSIIIESLLTALEHMVQVANRINEKQMEREEHLRRRLLRDEMQIEMSASGMNGTVLGEPILDGDLKVPGCRNTRTVLLCQNGLVVAKRVGQARWDIKQMIKCREMILFEFVPKQPLEFYVADTLNKVTLQAANADEKELWCKMIKQLIISTFETVTISERAKRILLDKKSNVLAQCQPTSNEVLDRFHFNLNRDDLLDLESSIRRILDPISPPSCNGTKHKNFRRRNSVDAIKSESKINFRDPSIHQWQNRRNHFNGDDDIDCRSIMIDVNEENFCMDLDKAYHSNIGQDRLCITDRPVDNDITLTREDIQDIFKPMLQMHDDVLINNLELASLCSDPDLDSVASDTGSNHLHKRQATSMDRNSNMSIYVKANSFTNSSDPSNPSSEFNDPSNRKKPLFSSVRETKSTRSNSDWGSLFDNETRSGLVKRFFKASAKLAKRDKRKCSTGHIDFPPSMVSKDHDEDLVKSPPINAGELKRGINKSNSSDFIVQSQNHLLQHSNSRKNKKSPQKPARSQTHTNGSSNGGIYPEQHCSPSLALNVPLKPPRQLPQFRIEMFDKIKSSSSDRLKTNQTNQLKTAQSLSNSPKSETDTPCKVKDLVSMFQSDR